MRAKTKQKEYICYNSYRCKYNASRVLATQRSTISWGRRTFYVKLCVRSDMCICVQWYVICERYASYSQIQTRNASTDTSTLIEEFLKQLSLWANTYGKVWGSYHWSWRSRWRFPDFEGVASRALYRSVPAAVVARTQPAHFPCLHTHLIVVIDVTLLVTHTFFMFFWR